MTENQQILVLQTGGTIGQERDAKGEFNPSPRDYIPLIRGISLVPGQSLQSTPEQVVVGELRRYRVAATFKEPAIEIDAIQTRNIDSTAMVHADRADLAHIIAEHAQDYDGFVVVHGTDTMVDTGTALSLMIRNLDKPIVLTGAQKSMYERASDGDVNFMHAVETATRDLGEVVISFGDKIVRANRALKVNEQGVNAFNSPRITPLGEYGIDTILYDHRIGRGNGDPIVFTEFETGVDFYSPRSGTDTTAFERGYVDNPSVKGIVFGGFGAGNIHPKFYTAIERALRQGKPVLVTTNCLEGAADMGVYAVSSEPLKAGAKPAGDMTAEAITQKLMFALGRARADHVAGQDVLGYVDRIIRRDYAREIAVMESRM
ncbi:MAG TPA: asparaginase [Candidatus Nanoarchaeia archaeon]|nr:asparaginase [Candidatus Nanoarchaeia archaeon]